MPESVEETRAAFLADLVRAGHLIPIGAPGVYGRGGSFEGVVEGLQRRITRAGADCGAEVMHFPPVFPRETYLKTDHLRTMPHLVGSVHGFGGDDARHAEMIRRQRTGEDWAGCLEPTDLMMVPAACYPLFPTAAGTLPEGGRTVDLLTHVFRREPSTDPARLQSFRQREYVRLGTPEQALAHRDEWLRRARELLAALGLDVTPVPANDPFFGRGGRVAGSMQRAQALKHELVCAISSREAPTAIASCNYHVDHFGQAFGIHTAGGQVAHSACVGFGLERVAMALLRTHGLEPHAWPEKIREALELTGAGGAGSPAARSAGATAAREG